MTKKTLKIFFLNLFLIAAFRCSNNNPVTPSEEQPGKRDYKWTVDTLPNYMTRMWGNTASDVWAIGQPGDFSKTIYHYDGNSWSTDEIFRSIIPSSIFGFAKNDIFLGCANSKIWNYDGSWKEIASLSKDGHTDIVFDNIWGESDNDLYAFGAYFDENGYANKSVIAHYSSGRWEMLNTDGLSGIVEHLYKNNADKKIYMQVIKINEPEHSDSTYIYEYESNGYTKIYGNIWKQGLLADISLINGDVYFSLGSKIAKRSNDKLITILTVDNPNFSQRIWGRNSKDIFLMMVDGLAHYNGSDIEYLFNYPFHTQISGAALFENDVFFLVNQSQGNLNLIYHGELNK